MKNVEERALEHDLFASIKNGEVLTSLYRTTLEAIAADPTKLIGDAATDAFVADLVSALAKSVSETELSELFSKETLHTVVADSLGVLAEHPELVAQDSEFAAKVLSDVLKAGAKASADGFDTEDFLMIADAAIDSAADNLAIVNIGDRYGKVLVGIGEALGAVDVGNLLTSGGRRETFLAALEAVAANPAVWGEFDKRELVQPLVVSILNGLATDPSGILSGTVLVDSVHAILAEAARRGKRFIDEEVETEILNQVLSIAISRANEEIGTVIDGENLPDFLRRVVAVFLKSPVTSEDDITSLIETELENLDTIH
jgi:hypothetical protein